MVPALIMLVNSDRNNEKRVCQRAVPIVFIILEGGFDFLIDTIFIYIIFIGQYALLENENNRLAENLAANVGRLRNVIFYCFLIKLG